MRSGPRSDLTRVDFQRTRTATPANWGCGSGEGGGPARGDGGDRRAEEVAGVAALGLAGVLDAASVAVRQELRRGGAGGGEAGQRGSCRGGGARRGGRARPGRCDPWWWRALATGWPAKAASDAVGPGG